MREFRAVALCLIVLAPLLGCPNGPTAGPYYHFQTVLDDSGTGVDPYAYASALNNSGTVAGPGGGGNPAVWQDDVVTYLPHAQPYSAASARAISNSGTVVGLSEHASGQDGSDYSYEVTVWKGGVESVLVQSTFSEWQNNGKPFAVSVWAINDNTEAAGSACVPPGTENAPALFRLNEIVLLPTLAPNTCGEAFDINASGDAVGYCDQAGNPTASDAVLWVSGEAISLGNLGEGSSLAHALNDQRQVVGLSSPPAGSAGACRAFVWSNGVMTPLPMGNAGAADAWDINNKGEIAGVVYRDSEPTGRAVIWKPKPGGGYTLVELQDRMLSPYEPNYTPFLTAAVDINERGQVLVYGYVYGGWVYVLLSPEE